MMSAADASPTIATAPASRAAGSALVGGAVLTAGLMAPPAGLFAATACVAWAIAAAPGGVRLRDVATPLSMALLAGCVLIGGAFGLATGVGMAFLWLLASTTRHAHTTISRACAIDGCPGAGRYASAPVWAMAALSALIVAASSPHTLVILPMSLPQPPLWLLALAAAACAVTLFETLLRLLTRWRLGEPVGATAAATMSAVTILALAFGASGDVSAGVLGLIAWRAASSATFQSAPTSTSAPQASLTAVP
jgi:hypothetical protein